MRVEQTLSFQKTVKKWHRNQKLELDKAIRDILKNPQIGQQKKGDLAEIRVHKFKMNTLLTLLAYTWEPSVRRIVLLKLGSHENFYRDLRA